MSRRRMRDEWGSITEVERGRRYRIRYWGKDSSGEYKRRSCTVRGTRRDAEKKRAELMLDHSDEAPCPTVGQVWERWAHPAYERRVEDGDLAPKSLQQYESMWSAHVSPRWADVPCDSVKPLGVQQWLDGMGASQATDAMSVLRPTLDYAVRYGVIETNPFRERYLMPSRRTVQSRDKGIWTYDQLHEVWNHVRGQWHEGAFLLAAFAGLRVGESLGVRADEVYESRGCAMVPIKRQMPNRGTNVTERLKNPQSERVVPVAGIVGKRLLELSEGSTWLSGDGMGNPNTQTRLTREWARTCAALPDGLAHPYRNLRNSYETNMRWVMKLPPWVVEPLMGHQSKGSQASTTTDRRRRCWRSPCPRRTRRADMMPSGTDRDARRLCSDKSAGKDTNRSAALYGASLPESLWRFQHVAYLAIYIPCFASSARFAAIGTR